jgi:hypothetical protein
LRTEGFIVFNDTSSSREILCHCGFQILPSFPELDCCFLQLQTASLLLVDSGGCPIPFSLCKFLECKLQPLLFGNSCSY